MEGASKDVLHDERQHVHFDADKMAAAIYGGEKEARQSLELGKILEEDPVFRKMDQIYLPRTQLFDRMLEQSRALIEMQKRLQLKGQ